MVFVAHERKHLSSLKVMFKFIKGVFDNWAKWKYRGSTSRSELLTAFLIIQTHDWSWGPRHRLPGVREGKNAPKSVTLFSVLFRFSRWDPRFNGFRIELIWGRPGFNFMPTARMTVFFGSIRDLLRRFLGCTSILIRCIRLTAVREDVPGLEAETEVWSTSVCFLEVNSSRSDWKASNIEAWKEPICCCKWMFSELPRDFSRFVSVLCCKYLG